jgi:transcription elongation factor Elf1
MGRRKKAAKKAIKKKRFKTLYNKSLNTFLGLQFLQFLNVACATLRVLSSAFLVWKKLTYSPIKVIKLLVDQKNKIGTLTCRICGKTFQTNITCMYKRYFFDINFYEDLTDPIDVFCEWIDRAEASQQQNEWYGTIGCRLRAIYSEFVII